MSLAGGTGNYSESILCPDFGYFLTNGGTLYPLFIVLIIHIYVLIPQYYIEKYTPGQSTLRRRF